MFVLGVSKWPSAIEVLRPDATGDMVNYRVTYDVVTDGHVRDCQLCGVRIIAGPIYRDASTLCVWHLDCFRMDVDARCAVDATTGLKWQLHQVEWITATN